MLNRHLAAVTFPLASLAAAACGGTSDFEPVGVAPAYLDGQLAVTNPTEPSFAIGTATNAPPSGGQPDVCTNLGVKCVKLTLNIQLPAGAWSKPGGVQVAIRWATDDDALDLYVYKDGTQVAKG